MCQSFSTSRQGWPAEVLHALNQKQSNAWLTKHAWKENKVGGFEWEETEVFAWFDSFDDGFEDEG